jgi:hypothetical protein
VSEADLETWLVGHEAQFPGDVHHVLKGKAEVHFGKPVGKNALYRVMTEVRGKLDVGNPRISRPT